MTLKAGAAQIEITPNDSQFLFGYPHVKRYSTGVHDRLWSSALYLSDGNEQLLFVANDIIFISKEVARQARKAISRHTGIKPENIMITATHTHSGPITANYISNQSDPVIPKADEKYVNFMIDSIIRAAVDAFNDAQDAILGLGIADDTGIGTNRRNPDGTADHQVPALLVKNALTHNNIACMLICSIHPTVLHEDSTLISGDFPGLSRIYLQENALGQDCPILHHTGPSGNQSPRYVTKENTFKEANRLGQILGQAVEKAISNIRFIENIELSVKSKLIDELPQKNFPTIETAQQKLKNAVEKLEQLRNSNAPQQEIRTAECDWFGAEEILTLAKASKDGSLAKAYQSCLPAEIQVFKVGNWTFIGWQGEIFTEYALAVKQKVKDTFVISLANGEMQGYIVTQEAADKGGYEASNALFSHQAGEIFIEKTIKILDELK